MAKLTANTWIVPPDGVDPVFLEAGSDAPAWADGVLGAHIVEDEKPKRPPVRSRSEKSES